MPQAETVTLSRGQKPIFPERCAFSGLPCGTQTCGFLTRDGITVLGDNVDFEFRDHEYAREFARLNGVR